MEEAFVDGSFAPAKKWIESRANEASCGEITQRRLSRLDFKVSVSPHPSGVGFLKLTSNL